MIRTAIACAVFLAGNFVYQSMAGRDWGVAVERSWFQFSAMIFVLAFHLAERDE